MNEINTDPKLIDELLTRSVSEVINFENLKEKLLSGKKLRIKLGIDPTSPNLHLGRAVPLLKLRDFQNLGHQLVFIVGDFTGVIGDTSDKDSERPMLTDDTVTKNMQSYIEQAGKIIDLEKTETYHNSEWLSTLQFAEIGTLADQFSVADFISRENIKKRLDEGKRVSLREVLYPLMQGYDSIAVKADVEIGGTDQRFNLLAGRRLQESEKQEAQNIIMLNLIPGSDGRKMSSSWGNTINLMDSARDMFGKVMSIPDNLIVEYFTNCTRIDLEKVKAYENQLKDDSVNPRDIKLELAQEITKLYHSEELAEAEKTWFLETFSKKVTPSDIQTITVKNDKNTIFDLVRACFPLDEKSNGDLKRLFEQNAITIEDKVYSNPTEEISLDQEITIKVGKRNWFKIKTRP